jgi:protein-tyrosine-phosphatase
MKILFLCTGNSARSQIAEALLRVMSDGHIQSYSAGTNPKGLHDLSVQVMREIGINIAHQTSKDLSTFTEEKFDLVITVCDRAREVCPVFPGAKMLHWNIEDPTDLQTFRKVRDEISLDSLLTSLSSHR